MNKAEAIEQILFENNLNMADIRLVNLLSRKSGDMVRVEPTHFFELIGRLHATTPIIRSFEIVGDNWFISNEASHDGDLVEVFRFLPQRQQPFDDTELDELEVELSVV